MRVEDITVEVRSVALGRLGQIDLDDIDDLKLIKRYCNVGSWSLSLSTEVAIAEELAKPGRGLWVIGPNDKTLMSGPVLDFVKTEATDDPTGTWSFQGSDDMIHLADGVAFPDPSTADVENQDESHDVYTAEAETVLRHYLDVNRGPSAPSSRRVAGIALQADSGRGQIVTGRARFDTLGALFFKLGQAGGIGFDMIQVDDEIVFHVYEPQDRSDLVRMDIENDLLDSTSYGFSAPTSTRPIIAGQGQLEKRRFIQLSTTESLAAEELWGRKIETFKDRRDTPDDAELIQEGETLLEEGGTTIHSLSVTPADELTMVYGVDWYLGDIVGVVVDGEELTAVVTEAIIAIDSEGVRVAATIGDPTGFDFESKMIAKQQDTESRVAFLEKNEASAAAIAAGYYATAGDIKATARSTTVPGWLLCDGASYLRTDYPDLFDAIGVQFGAVDGTHFNVPNLKGKVIAGIDVSQTEFNTRGKTGGAKTHILTTGEMPVHTHVQNAHTHTVSDPGHNHTQNAHTHTQNSHSHGVVGGAGSFLATGLGASNANWVGTGASFQYNNLTAAVTATNQNATATNNAQFSGVTNQSTTATNQNAGSGAAHNNLQPYMALHYLIKI